MSSGLFLRSAGRRPFSRLFICSDGAQWSLREDAAALRQIAGDLGIDSEIVPVSSAAGVARQAVFFCSQFILLQPGFHRGFRSRTAFSYFHGRNTSRDPYFLRCFESLKKHHQQIARIQTSCAAMRDFILESGIDPSKVHVIPIGVHADLFSPQTQESRVNAQKMLGIPEGSRVIGSFQKDGVGWGEGNDPKMIKGPDILLNVLSSLKQVVPDLFVLLSGPARGYVKHGLSNLGIPFLHRYLESYLELPLLYQACDLVLVTSREEGGPKAVLESMASGIPLVTTAVGQAVDLIRHGVNGWIVDVEDEEELAHWSRYILDSGSALLAPVLRSARVTAENNSYKKQGELWGKFFKGILAEG